jgi:hypothetical protein
MLIEVDELLGIDRDVGVEWALSNTVPAGIKAALSIVFF